MNHRYLLTLLVCVVFPISTVAAAEPKLTAREVAAGVYAIIGDLGGQTYENEGQNANLGFIVMSDGVIAVNTGASSRVAKAMHATIKARTDKPVKWAVNVNSQPHYWLGNDYFKSIGAKIVAHKEADRIMRDAGLGQLERTKETLKERAADTKLAYPDVLFTDKHHIKLGGGEVQVLHFGHAHTPGDSVVWLPKEKVLFSGDIIYTERMLAVIPISHSGNWIAAFDKAAALGPKVIVPGHGGPTQLDRARKETRNYLAEMRAHVKKKQNDFIDLQETVDTADQSKYKHLENFDQLARRNVNQIYLELEKELFK